MLNIYGSVGSIELIEEFFYKSISNDVSPRPYNLLIKAYGSCNLPDRAEELVRRMLHKQSTTKPSMYTINTLLNCWSVLTTPEHQAVAAERAFNIYYWMKSNDECIKLNLKPNYVTFSTLMKCVISSAMYATKNSNLKHSVNSSIEERVETILQEMNTMYNEVERSHVGVRSGAIKALLIAKNYQRAEEILELTEKTYQDDNGSSSQSVHNEIGGLVIPFSVNTYIPFFKFYSRLRTTFGAQRAEKLHNRMRKLSQEKSDPKLKPNNTTYNMILDAWVKSGDANATTYLWSIYEQMKADKLNIGSETYSMLVKALSCSNGGKDRRRLNELMQHVHNQNKINNGEIYTIALNNCMSRGDTATVTRLMKLLISSYMQGHITMNADLPDRAKFNWIISSYISSNDLTSATMFLEDIVQQATVAPDVNDGTSLDVSWIGPDFKMLLELRKAWTEIRKHNMKDYYISKMDEQLIPVMARLLNIAKGNIQPQLPPGKRGNMVRQRQTSSAS